MFSLSGSYAVVFFLVRYALQGSSIWAEKGYPFPKEDLAKANEAAILAEDRFKPANRRKWSKKYSKSKETVESSKSDPKQQKFDNRG